MVNKSGSATSQNTEKKLSDELNGQLPHHNIPINGKSAAHDVTPMLSSPTADDNTIAQIDAKRKLRTSRRLNSTNCDLLSPTQIANVASNIIDSSNCITPDIGSRKPIRNRRYTITDYTIAASTSASSSLSSLSNEKKVSPLPFNVNKSDANKCADQLSVDDLTDQSVRLNCSVSLKRLSDDFVNQSTNSGNTTNDGDKDDSNGGNKILCLYCDRSFLSNKLHSRHVERVHQSASGRRLSARTTNTNSVNYPGCPYCNVGKIACLSTVELTQLILHQLREHSDKYFACENCMLRFQNRDQMLNHFNEQHKSRRKLKSMQRSMPEMTTSFDEQNDESTNDTIDIEPQLRNRLRRSAADLNKSTSSSSSPSTRNVKSRMLSSEETFLSRLGITQNRSPRSRKGAKNRRGCSSELFSLEMSRSSRSTSTTKLISKSSINSTTNSNETIDFVPPKSTSSKNEPIVSAFDEDFYESVNLNVKHNLSHHIDGKLEDDTTTPSAAIINTISNVPTVRSILVKSPLVVETEIHEATTISAFTAFPTLLTAQQYGVEMQTGKMKKPITKNSWKWKWDSVKKYKYVNEGGKIVKKVKQPMGGMRDLSKLDMWTQLTMRSRHEIATRQDIELIGDDGGISVEEIARDDKRKLIEQLNKILDTRVLPQISVEQSDQTIIKMENATESRSREREPNSPTTSAGYDNDTKDENFPSALRLIKRDQSTDAFKQPTVLSGEWARPRCYICCGCGSRFPTVRLLEEHKLSKHPYVHSTHYEIVGKELIDGDLFRNFYIPSMALQRRSEAIVQSASFLCTDDSMDSLTSYSLSLSKSESIDLDSNSRNSKVSTSSSATVMTSITTTSPVEDDENANITAAVQPQPTIRKCTKCERDCNGKLDLYRHMLECSNDYAWLLAKKRNQGKYRYFGSRRRRPHRSSSANIRKTIKTKKESESCETPPRKSKEPNTPRPPRPSDAESIKRMLENLPAKRAVRQIFPNLAPKPNANKTFVANRGKLSTKQKKSSNNPKLGYKLLSANTTINSIGTNLALRKRRAVDTRRIKRTTETTTHSVRRTRSTLQSTNDVGIGDGLNTLANVEKSTKKLIASTNKTEDDAKPALKKLKKKNDLKTVLRRRTRAVVKKITNTFRGRKNTRMLRTIKSNTKSGNSKQRCASTQRDGPSKTTTSAEMAIKTEEKCNFLRKLSFRRTKRRENMTKNKDCTKTSETNQVKVDNDVSKDNKEMEEEVIKCDTNDDDPPTLEMKIEENEVKKSFEAKKEKTKDSSYLDNKDENKAEETIPTPKLKRKRSIKSIINDIRAKCQSKTNVEETRTNLLPTINEMQAKVAETKPIIDKTPSSSIEMGNKKDVETLQAIAMIAPLSVTIESIDEPLDLSRQKNPQNEKLSTSYATCDVKPMNLILPSPQISRSNSSSTESISPRRRMRKLNDCIAMLAGKIQEKLGVPFIDQQSASVLNVLSPTSKATTSIQNDSNAIESKLVDIDKPTTSKTKIENTTEQMEIGMENLNAKNVCEIENVTNEIDEKIEQTKCDGSEKKNTPANLSEKQITREKENTKETCVTRKENAVAIDDGNMSNMKPRQLYTKEKQIHERKCNENFENENVKNDKDNVLDQVDVDAEKVFMEKSPGEKKAEIENSSTDTLPKTSSSLVEPTVCIAAATKNAMKPKTTNRTMKVKSRRNETKGSLTEEKVISPVSNKSNEKILAASTITTTTTMMLISTPNLMEETVIHASKTVEQEKSSNEIEEKSVEVEQQQSSPPLFKVEIKDKTPSNQNKRKTPSKKQSKASVNSTKESKANPNKRHEDKNSNAEVVISDTKQVITEDEAMIASKEEKTTKKARATTKPKVKKVKSTIDAKLIAIDEIPSTDMQCVNEKPIEIVQTVNEKSSEKFDEKLDVIKQIDASWENETSEKSIVNETKPTRKETKRPSSKRTSSTVVALKKSSKSFSIPVNSNFDSSEDELLPWDPETGFVQTKIAPDNFEELLHLSDECQASVAKPSTTPKSSSTVVDQSLVKGGVNVICPAIVSVTASSTTPKAKKKRKNELAQIIEDQLLESFKSDKSRIDELKRIQDMSMSSSEELLSSSLSNTPTPKRYPKKIFEQIDTKSRTQSPKIDSTARSKKNEKDVVAVDDDAKQKSDNVVTSPSTEDFEIDKNNQANKVDDSMPKDVIAAVDVDIVADAKSSPETETPSADEKQSKDDSLTSTTNVFLGGFSNSLFSEVIGNSKSSTTTLIASPPKILLCPNSLTSRDPNPKQAIFGESLFSTQNLKSNRLTGLMVATSSVDESAKTTPSSLSPLKNASTENQNVFKKFNLIKSNPRAPFLAATRWEANVDEKDDVKSSDNKINLWSRNADEIDGKNSKRRLIGVMKSKAKKFLTNNSKKKLKESLKSSMSSSSSTSSSTSLTPRSIAPKKLLLRPSILSCNNRNDTNDEAAASSPKPDDATFNALKERNDSMKVKSTNSLTVKVNSSRNKRKLKTEIDDLNPKSPIESDLNIAKIAIALEKSNRKEPTVTAAVGATATTEMSLNEAFLVNKNRTTSIRDRRSVRKILAVPPTMGTSLGDGNESSQDTMISEIVNEIREKAYRKDSDDELCLASEAIPFEKSNVEEVELPSTTTDFETKIDKKSSEKKFVDESVGDGEDDNENDDEDVLEDNASVYTTMSHDTSITSSAGTSKRKKRKKRSILSRRRRTKRNDTFVAPTNAHYCDLCRKSFRNSSSLTAHKATISHISKVSAQDFLDAKKRAEDQASSDGVVERQVEESTIVEKAVSPRSVLEAESTTTDKSEINFPAASAAPTVVRVTPPEEWHRSTATISPKIDNLLSTPKQKTHSSNSRLTLSQEERLFYECCSMLKGSDRTSISDLTKTEFSATANLVTPKIIDYNTNIAHSAQSPRSHPSPHPGHRSINPNHFSDISSDSNPAYSCPHVPSSSKTQKVFALDGVDPVPTIGPKNDFPFKDTQFTRRATKASPKCDENSFGSRNALNSSSMISRNYPETFSDMGDSYPSSQDASESENYAQTILERSNRMTVQSNASKLDDSGYSIAPFQSNDFPTFPKRSQMDSPMYSTSSQSSSVSRPRTKAAMKGYENLKVSIPTTGLDLHHAIDRSPNANGCKLAALADIALGDAPSPFGHSRYSSLERLHSPKSIESSTVVSAQRENSTATKAPSISSDKTTKKHSVGNRLGFKVRKKKPRVNIKTKAKDNKSDDKVLTENMTETKPKDIYDFEESGDSVENAIVPLTLARPAKSELPTKAETVEQEKTQTKKLTDEVEEESSYSDRDDYYNFNSVSGGSATEDDADDDSRTMVSEEQSVKSKTSGKSAGNAKKKCFIVGRIFKNAKKNADTSIDTQENKAKKTVSVQRPNIDEIFDNLRTSPMKNCESINVDAKCKEKSSTKVVIAVNLTSKKPDTENKSSNSEIDSAKQKALNKSRKSREVANLEAELGMSMDQIKELIGVGMRKTQRRCATNRQKNFMETWSSDEYEDFHSTKDVIALIQEAEMKAQRAKAKQTKQNTENAIQSTPNPNDMNKTDEKKVKTKATEKSNENQMPKTKKTVFRDVKSDDSDFDEHWNKSSKRAKIRNRRRTIASREDVFDEKIVSTTNIKARTKPKATINVDTIAPMTATMKATVTATATKKPSTIEKKKETTTETSDAVKAASAGLKPTKRAKPMPRRKRIASEMLYYWSSSSDEDFGRIEPSEMDDDETNDNHLEQHGWIVGDSHKKLVTLLAHAKGKKIEDCGVKEGAHKKK